MASGPITSWQIDGEKIETVTDFWGPKSPQTVTTAVKLRHLLPGRRAMTNLGSTLKSTLPTLVRLVKSGFSSSHVQM